MSYKADGNFTVPVVSGPPRWRAPFASNEFCLFEQDYVRLRANWAAGTIGTTQTVGGETFYLVAEGDRRPEGYLDRWTQSWAKIPTAWDGYESYAYSFIGFSGVFGAGTTLPSGRDRYTRTVKSRVAHAYFLVKAGTTYATAEALWAAQAIEPQKYVLDGSTMEVDWLTDNPPYTFDTDPTRTYYEEHIIGTEIVAECSLKQWMGCIYERITRYVVAE